VHRITLLKTLGILGKVSATHILGFFGMLGRLEIPGRPNLPSIPIGTFVSLGGASLFVRVPSSPRPS
jgi:hypothetical protein